MRLCGARQRLQDEIVHWFKILAATLATLFVAVVAVRLFNPLPSIAGRTDSHALSGLDTLLGRSLAGQIAAHRGKSGLYLLDDVHDAFAARVQLARAAQRTIDAQYYIWHGDLTGTLLFDELRSAADRGVRVRLLLDDNNTAGLDPLLAGLDEHPNIEVRLFNPFTVRRPRLLGWLMDFPRLNHRMHNKSFTVDNQATIIGGRNIGDEYFGAGSSALFVDLDALAVGPVTSGVSRQFDQYWSSASAYPAARILAHRSTGKPVDVRTEAQALRSQPAAIQYLDTVRSRPVDEKIRAGTLPFEWVRAELVADNPAKALGKAGPGELLITRLGELMAPNHQLRVVSGYFVPTATTVRVLSDMSRRGTSVSVVTNSYEATDVPIVHAGCAGDRKALLEAGIHLWEMRAGSGASAPRRTVRGSGSAVPGSSGQALHAKTFTADGERLFIGSFNFDPRSARLNTELGFVIRSPTLAKRVDSQLERALPREAYELQLAHDGRIIWIEHRGTTTVRHEAEPGTTRLSRVLVTLTSWIPIKWLL